MMMVKKKSIICGISFHKSLINIIHKIKLNHMNQSEGSSTKQISSEKQKSSYIQGDYALCFQV